MHLHSKILHTIPALSLQEMTKQFCNVEWQSLHIFRGQAEAISLLAEKQMSHLSEDETPKTAWSDIPRFCEQWSSTCYRQQHLGRINMSAIITDGSYLEPSVIIHRWFVLKNHLRYWSYHRRFVLKTIYKNITNGYSYKPSVILAA